MAIEHKWHNIKDSAIGELQKILKVDITCRANEELYELVKDKTFYFDEQSALILWIQKRLRAMGYYRDYPNGVWRQTTINSIYKMQSVHSLKCEGLNADAWYLLLRS